MTTTPIVQNNTTTIRLCFTALFAALACAGTFIAVPLPIGYFNLGDIFVLCAAWCLGPIPGAAAAAVGTALADVLMGYVSYAPATFLIKGCIALIACLLFRTLSAVLKKEMPARIISAAAGEVVMVAGYFVFEAVFMGYGFGALASVPGNALQAAAGIIGASALISVLCKNRVLTKFFDV